MTPNPLWQALVLLLRLWWRGVRAALQFWFGLFKRFGFGAGAQGARPAAPGDVHADTRHSTPDTLPALGVVEVQAKEVPPSPPPPPPPPPPFPPAPAPASDPDPDSSDPENDPPPDDAPAARNKPTRSRFISGSFTNLAGQRKFKLFLPGGPPSAPPPLIVMLHGCKQDPVDFARGTQMNVWAEQQGCAVLYPAQTEVANRYACWNWYLPIHQQRGLGEPALLAGMIEQLVGKHSLNPRRVFVAGLSAGAAMANVLAHTYPEMFAGLGVHSGLPYAAAHDVITALAVMKHGRRATRWPYLHPSLPPFAPHNLPLIVFHGDADTTVHPLNGEQVVDQALREEHAPGSGGHETLPPPTVQTGQAAGGHAYTLTRYGAPQGLPALEYWLVEGLEHAWSGGDGRGSFTDSQGPVASQEMLRFFLEQPPARPRQRLAEAEATGDVAKPSDPPASG